MSKRLNELITETGCEIREQDFLEEVRVIRPIFIEVVSVEEDCEASATVIRAISQSDPVLYAPVEEGVDIQASGNWDNRKVSIVVTISLDGDYDDDEEDEGDDRWNIKLIFETNEAGYNGRNVISFRWDFHPSNIVNLGVAEMNFGDHLGDVDFTEFIKLVTDFKVSPSEEGEDQIEVLPQIPDTPLSENEVAALRAIAHSDGNIGITHFYAIETNMRKSGFSAATTKLALGILQGKGYIQIDLQFDYESERDYQVISLLPKAWNWYALHQDVTKPIVEPASDFGDYDDQPF